MDAQTARAIGHVTNMWLQFSGNSPGILILSFYDLRSVRYVETATALPRMELKGYFYLTLRWPLGRLKVGLGEESLAGRKKYGIFLNGVCPWVNIFSSHALLVLESTLCVLLLE